MEPAIITITCPSCGGKVEGVRTTDAPQTIPCSYCKTELHVPRVGDEIVRETKIVHEVRTVEAEPVSFPPLRRPPPPMLPVAIAGGICAILLMIFIAKQRGEADDMIKTFDRQHAERDACEAGCKSKCANAPSRNDQSSTGDPKLDQELADTMRKADITSCEIQCEQEQDCWKLQRH